MSRELTTEERNEVLKALEELKDRMTALENRYRLLQLLRIRSRLRELETRELALRETAESLHDHI